MIFAQTIDFTDALLNSPGWLIHLLELGLAWVVSFPLLTLSYALLVVLAYNLVGGGLGLVDLFWHENRRVQFLNGAFAAALVGQILYIRYLVGEPLQVIWGSQTAQTVTVLFWWPDLPRGAENPFHELAVYLWLYPVALLILGIPAFFRPQDQSASPGGSQIGRRWPLLVGMAVTLVIVVLLLGVIAQFVSAARLPGWVKCFAVPPGTTASETPPASLQNAFPWQSLLMGLVALGFLGVCVWAKRFLWAGAFLLLVIVLLLVTAGLGSENLLPHVVLEGKVVRMPIAHPLEVYLLGVGLTILFLIAVVVVGMLYRRSVQTPVLAAITLLAFVLGGSSLVGIYFPGGQTLILVLLLLWAALTNLPPHKIRLPDLETAYDLPLAGQEDAAAKAPAPAPDLELLDGDVVLTTAAANWNSKNPEEYRPKLIVLAVSGGGIQAAVYTCAVLEQLEAEDHNRGLKGLFPGQVRLITGASGGMVGAAYYVAHRALRQRTDLPRLPPRRFSGNLKQLPSCHLAQAMALDSLSPTASTMLLHDLPFIWVPTWSKEDRGRTLEDAWLRNTRDSAGNSPLAATLYDLRAHEASADVPSLIFSPMLVEDARRLLLSNLDLHRIGLTGPRTTPAARPNPVYSLSAVEFFREFPAVRKSFPLRTAARLNASFPIISPALFLPPFARDVLRRPVDAGYYDNYGIDLACEWIRRHQDTISRLFSGLLLVQVRAYPTEQERLKVLPASKGTALRWLTSPLDAILSMRQRSPWYRNDEIIDDLPTLFRDTNGPDFFRTKGIECSHETPLSWYLTPAQTERTIQAAIAATNTALTEQESWLKGPGFPYQG